ncbi:MAG: hypothetical protein IPH02_16775 [Sphingobacteriales bacterium]|nr:hypothetical protein [Sphingobacteriales bacterium]
MFAQIPLPAVPCRAAPSDRAEMTNQLLFGELGTNYRHCPKKRLAANTKPARPI